MDITSSNNINKYANITSHCCVKNYIRITHSYDSGDAYKKILYDIGKSSNKVNSDGQSKEHNKKKNIKKIKKRTISVKHITSSEENDICINNLILDKEKDFCELVMEEKEYDNDNCLFSFDP